LGAQISGEFAAIQSAIRLLVTCVGYLLIRSNFWQMAMHGENNPNIIAKPDGQVKLPAQM